MPATATVDQRAMRPASDPTDRNQSMLYDTPAIYGWISIVLHWSTAILIIALWFIGKSITSADEVDARRALHVSIAGAAWILILFRIAWRLRAGHPHVRGLGEKTFRVAKSAHYLMIVTALLMLLSGPLLVWASGNAIDLFGILSIPGPIGHSESIREMAWTVHESAALVLAILVVLHLCGALKHLMFHTDDTIVRMLWPVRPETDQE